MCLPSQEKVDLCHVLLLTILTLLRTPWMTEVSLIEQWCCWWEDCSRSNQRKSNKFIRRSLPCGLTNLCKTKSDTSKDGSFQIHCHEKKSVDLGKNFQVRLSSSLLYQKVSSWLTWLFSHCYLNSWICTWLINCADCSQKSNKLDKFLIRFGSFA